jgi:hypothetical protein
MANELLLREVPFHGDVMMAGHEGEETYVGPKPVCELFGLSWEGQRDKLVKTSEEGGWASTKIILVVGQPFGKPKWLQMTARCASRR